MNGDDMALVREYAQSNSEQAFATLVTQHVNLVYSVALRQVSDSQLAEEITQSVFIILARKAKSLSPKTILSGWLCRTARYVAANTLSIQRRRQMREQEVQMQVTLNETDSNPWNQIAPLLDEALNCLGEKEHDAVVLRFFDGKELKQVGAAMGTTEDGARMRVNRAVAKLRKFCIKRGVTLSATALTGAVAANGVQAAPAGLAAAITAAALSGTTITTTAVIAATKAIAMTTLQKTIIGATLAAAVGTGIYEARQASQLRKESESQNQQIAQLKLESESHSNRLTSVANVKSLPNEQFNELLRLRGQVTALRQAEQENARLKMERDALAKRIEEASAKLPEHDPGFQMRRDKMNYLANWGLALKVYARTNSWRLPTSLAEAAPSMPNPDAFFSSVGASFREDQFEMVYQGSLTNLEDPTRIIVIKEREPVRVSNGSWARAYLFADGHTETHLAADGDFTAWEQERLPR